MADPTGAGAGAAVTPSGAGAAGAGSPSSAGVKPDVNAAGSQQIPTHDDKGVPWMNRAKELEERYKDVDLDRYSKFKDMDPDEVGEAMKTYETLLADETKFKKVMEILKAQQEVQDDPKPANDGAAKELRDRVNALEQAEKNRITKNWMEKYETGISESIAENLKGELKDLGELSPLEQEIIRSAIDRKFQADQRQRKPVLSLKNVPEFVAQELKRVKENRAFVVSKSVKRETSPEGIHGGSQSSRPNPNKPRDAADRIADMQKGFKEMQANKGLTI